MDPVEDIELRRRTGVVAGRMQIWPGREARHAVAVLESSSHSFTLDLEGDVRASGVEPAELFSLDEHLDGRSGQLQTGNHVGTVEVRVTTADGERLFGQLEVRSAKLDHDSHYQWMLSGVAEDGSELVLRSFAATSTPLAADPMGDARTLYQQLAFLSAILEREHTVEAFERVLRSPHVSYAATEDPAPIGRGVAGSSQGLRTLTRPGPRQPAPAGLPLPSLPRSSVDRTPVATVDTPPNQFIRYTLDVWDATLARARVALSGSETAAARRGQREVARLQDRVTGWRTDRRLADVSRLQRFPAGNQVLLRRSGYRDIHQAFLESRAVAMLRWDGLDAVHRGGLRDIATLYEYWAYLELRRIVESLCVSSDAKGLTELTEDGMHLRLIRGRSCVVRGIARRGPQVVDVELWFNRGFTQGRDTWTMSMRPDCSVRLGVQRRQGEDVQTWVHFDAKYRVDAVDQLVESDPATGQPKRPDLLKMHAYRDAIRGSSGAYVLYPGTEARAMRQHHEILPGLGAFPLVPGSDGHATASSASSVAAFLDDVIDHVVDQATNDRRASYWTTRAHAAPARARGVVDAPFTKPLADTRVLLGYYRDSAHLEWIETQRLYNMRTGSRPGAVTMESEAAAAEFLVLWSTGDPVRVWRLRDQVVLLDAAAMRERGYPRTPRGVYLCHGLAARVDAPDGWDLGPPGPPPKGEPFGAPRVVTADELWGPA